MVPFIRDDGDAPFVAVLTKTLCNTECARATTDNDNMFVLDTSEALASDIGLSLG
jgi:hypothetical protein